MTREAALLIRWAGMAGALVSDGAADSALISTLGWQMQIDSDEGAWDEPVMAALVTEFADAMREVGKRCSQ
jgi:hypothetical protein